jgi:GNAT superfamily N-acetyltransferase
VDDGVKGSGSWEVEVFVTLINVGQVGSHSVACRIANEKDNEFCYAVYASTRAQELAQVPWTPEERERFLRQQFKAQDHAYRNNYPGAEFLIIVVDGADAGRLYAHRRPDEIRIMDVALLPPFRAQGIGTYFLKEFLREGQISSRIVTIHVEVFNPARRLYQRLGFRPVGENAVYCLMEWRPSTQPSQTGPAAEATT